ncbi:hypothetical protein COV19_04945 [Candidatus Woesearchaeota archaeon CG10_big_fil_rev_8_21_14_0_10_44_13]|nr:MAG: hypothetical protein COV19_04945 [Candidatus Woesearchaeota archaeon CG10_big_fil_rev_8_21_14_0_10_44_13]
MVKRGNGSAQASVEYLMVAGIAFAIILPMVYIFYTYSTDMGQEVTFMKLGRINNELVRTAEEFYYLGAPSKTTVSFEMPFGLYDVQVSENMMELIFLYGDKNDSKEIVGYSEVPVRSYLIPGDLLQGKKEFIVEAKPGYSIIYRGNYEEARIKWCGYYISGQIKEYAGEVFRDHISRSRRLIVPADCLVVDIGISFGSPSDSFPLRMYSDGEPADTTYTMGTKIAQDSFIDEDSNTKGIVRNITKTYDFIYKGTFVDIVLPICHDNDGDGYGNVLYSTACGDEAGDDRYNQYDCFDDPSIITDCNFPLSEISCDDALYGGCAKCTHPDASEYCDELDNNCNAQKDEGFGIGDKCLAGYGLCAVDGGNICSIDKLSSVCSSQPDLTKAADELCDGLDNDCDSYVDNNPDANQNYTLVESCAPPTGTSVCKASERKCLFENDIPEWGLCSQETYAQPEVCYDGMDNDCDGLADCDDPKCTGVGRKNLAIAPDWTSVYSMWNADLREYAVLWFTGASSAKSLHFGRADASGSLLSDVVIDTGTISDPGSAIAWTGSEYGVVWPKTTTGSRIFFIRMDGSGNKLMDSVELITPLHNGAYNPSIAWSGSQYGVAWKEDRVNSWAYDIYFTKITDVTWNAGTIIRESFSQRANSGPSFVWTGSEYGISWSESQTSAQPYTYKIYFSRLDNDGTKLTETKISDNDQTYKAGPSLAWSGSGYGLAWVDKRDLTKDIIFSSMSPSGIKLKEMKVTNLDTINGAQNPSIAWNGLNSEYGIVWLDRRYVSTGGYETFFARVDSTGTYVKGEKRITANPGDAGSPSIASNGPSYGLFWYDNFDSSAGAYFEGMIGPEICDGIDNNCDGSIDNDPGSGDDTLSNKCSYYTGSVSTENIGICSASKRFCASGAWGTCVPEVKPQTEICGDSLDNDCDGLKDCEDPSCKGITGAAIPISTSKWSDTIWNPAKNEFAFLGQSDLKLYFSLADSDGKPKQLDFKDVKVLVSSTVFNSNGKPTSFALNPAQKEYGLAWCDSRDGNVYFARIDENGNEIDLDGDGTSPDFADTGDFKKVSNTGGYCYDASIVWNPNRNEYGVLWTQAPTSSLTVNLYFARLDAYGTKVTSDISLKSAFAIGWSGPAIDLLLVGQGYGVVWDEVAGSNSDIFFTRLDGYGARADVNGDSVIDSNDYIKVAETSLNSFAPSLVWAGSEYGLAWHDTYNTGSVNKFMVYFTKFGSSGEKKLSNINITPSFLSDPRAPVSLAWNNDLKEYALVWGDKRDDVGGVSYNLYFARLNQDGFKIGQDEKIYPSLNYYYGPSIEWNGRLYGIYSGTTGSSGSLYSSRKPEVCDGFDNDCDTIMDNIPTTTSPLTAGCYDPLYSIYAGIGQCTKGTRTCVLGGWDNPDCDGAAYPQLPKCFVQGDYNCDGINDIGVSTKLTSDSKNYNPDISGNIIVWNHFAGHLDPATAVYMCDLAKNGQDGGCLENDLKTRVAAVTDNNPVVTRISGNVIVWSDGTGAETSGEIYMCDLAKNGQDGGCLENDLKTRVTEDSNLDFNPSIDGNLIIWSHKRGSSALDVYMCDLAKNGQPGGCLALDTKTQISDMIGWKADPDSNGNIIAWTLSGDIYFCDLAKNGQPGGCLAADAKTKIPATSASNNRPSVYGGKIAYAGTITSPSTKYPIFLYDIASDTVTQISTLDYGATNPKIYGSKAVWSYNTCSICSPAAYIVYGRDLSTSDPEVSIVPGRSPAIDSSTIIGLTHYYQDIYYKNC